MRKHKKNVRYRNSIIILALDIETYRRNNRRYSLITAYYDFISDSGVLMHPFRIVLRSIPVSHCIHQRLHVNRRPIEYDKISNIFEPNIM